MKIKAVLVSVCLMMAAANSAFAIGENEKCKDENPILAKSLTVEKKNTCTFVLEFGDTKISKTRTCDCKPFVACLSAKHDAYRDAGWL